MRRWILTLLSLLAWVLPSAPLWIGKPDAVLILPTFIVARLLSRNFRAKRKAKEEARRDAERRATETRQVRRARERRGK